MTRARHHRLRHDSTFTAKAYNMYQRPAVFLELTVDIAPDSDLSKLPRYIQLSTTCPEADATERLFAGNRVQLKISKILWSQAHEGYDVKISAFSKLRDMLQDGDPLWDDEELETLEVYQKLNDEEYVYVDLVPLNV